MSIADLHESVPTRQDSIQTLKPDKPPIPETRLYQGVYISKEGLTEAIEHEFATYGISDQIERAKNVITCESGWNIFAYNKEDEKFVKGGSYGIAQFTRPTFLACAGDYEDPYDQIACMAWYWSKSQQSRWTCYRNLYKTP